MRGQTSAIITHFSHPHPLHLTNPKPSLICSACKQTLDTEPLYTCKSPSCTTNYSLHLKCSQLPYTITHPCHRHRHRHDHHNHPLSLLTRSQNPNGVFTCRACAKHGDGFLYKCKDCGINIHVACAELPLWVSHQSHCHQLGLVFTSPYGNNMFSCNVCGVVEGRKCWLYRCDSCGFDAHLSCVTSKTKTRVVNGAGTSSNNNFETLFMNQVNNKRDQILQGLMAGNNNMNNQAVQSGRSSTTDQFEKWFVDQVNIKRDQIMQGIMAGGGGNMNNNQLHQPMMVGAGVGVGVGAGGGGNMNYDQLLQAANMNNQLLQNMMGGGGNMYNQALQAMMGSGGGEGSSQLLQAMMGGGGLDISSILANFGGLMGAGFGGFGF